MAPLDSVPLATDISEEQPTGPNLEFDPDFGALERAAQGKTEQQYGSIVVPAEDPDWKEVAAQAAALNERTHDLRVMVLLAISRLHTAGFEAFAEVLTAIRQVLETRWEQVHPQLDPDDDNDPTLRANALLALKESRRVLRFLRDMPLAADPRAGRFSWRDISVAVGNIDPEEGKTKPNETDISAAFQKTDQAKLQSLRAALVSADRELVAIPAIFDSRSGLGSGPDFTDMAKLVRETQRFMDRYSPAAGAVAEAVEAPAEGAGAESPAVPLGGTAQRATGTITATSLKSISSRTDAVWLLDLVVGYYERYEPSSPLPLLINRARRLADLGFMDILRDLAPQGVSQVQSIVGVQSVSEDPAS